MDISLILEKTWEQLYLTGLGTGIAILIGVPLGIWIVRLPKLKRAVLGFANILQTIPSLAVLAFLLPFFGIGLTPALIALSLYALLPIVRNTSTGLAGVSPEMIEAANGLGFTRIQKLWMVELPLALPVIIAGIRTATAMSVGIATLAAFIGAGGLGDFIYQGLTLNDNRLILMGAIPAALLALVLDFLIGRIERWISERRYKRLSRFAFATVAGLFATVIIAVIFFINLQLFTRTTGEVVVATKTSTEQLILGEIIAQTIAAKTHLKVIRKFNLGTTAMCHQAMLRGDIDIYPEYTGTAYLVVLKRRFQQEAPEKLFNQVRSTYAKQFHIIWLAPFGFNDTQALIVTRHFAKQHHLTTISDLVPIAQGLTIGARAAFLKRPDALPGLKQAYHLRFKKEILMDPGLMYKALVDNKVDIISGDSTDGRIAAYHLLLLQDNKHFFPSYLAAPVIREQTLKKYPQLIKALQPLAGVLNNKVMQQLNYEVDLGNKTPSQVAHQFLLHMNRH